MQKVLGKISGNILLVLLAIPLLAEITLTDKEYEAVLKRLKRDKQIIRNNDKRWKKLKKSKPKINYSVKDEQIVIQNIEIPVYNAKPLKYEIKLKVTVPEKEPKWFPWTFFLCGMVETGYTALEGETFKVTPDVKIGVQFFSFKRLGFIFKVSGVNLGLNLMVGIHSSGASLSYTIPKVLKNTSIHAYVGITYKARISYGLGIGLNF